MPFSSLPREIICQILVEAVLSRGAQRAQRLRFVSRDWNEAVARAIVESGVLETHRSRAQSVLWPRYSAYKALNNHLFLGGGGDKVPIRLYVVRRVAERVLDYIGNNGRTPPESLGIVTLRDALEVVCAMRHTSLGTVGSGGEDLLDINVALPATMNRKMKEYYDEVLLGTAAWLNDLNLLKETLQSVEDVPGPREHLLRYAISAAAYKGHNEAAMLLLDAIQDPKVKSEAAQHLLQAASKGSQLPTLELGLLRLDCVERNEHTLDRPLRNTTSLAIYEWLYPLARDFGTARQRYYPLYLATMVMPDCMREMAGGGGEVALLDRLLHQPDLKLVTWYKPARGVETNPLYRAARSGRLEAVTCLLQHPKKFPLCSGVLLAAVKSGNPDLVQLLLEHPATADWPLGEALVEATCREHLQVVRMLFAVGSSRITAEDTANAIDASRSRGLESMEQLILEYSHQR